MKKGTINSAIASALRYANKPLSAKEIYDVIEEQDFYRFRAENPHNIVRVQLRRHCKGLDFPTASKTKHFEILKSGLYWIKDESIPNQNKEDKELIKSYTPTKKINDQLKDIHSKYIEDFRSKTISQLKEVDPSTFETFSKKLLQIYGFEEVEVTKVTNDGGIDGFGKLKVGLTHLKVAFQCKRWRNNIPRPEIDKFRGACQGEYEMAIFFTTAKFSEGAKGAEQKPGAVPVILIDGKTIVDIMIDKKFGVQVETLPILINALDEVLADD